MYQMTLKEQADVLARLSLTAPSDTTRSATIEAGRARQATVGRCTP